MELEQIKAIIEMMKENELTEFSMESEGLKIRLKRGPEGVLQTVTVATAPVAAAATVAAAIEAKVPAADVKHITSPMVGTFYRSPSPDAASYIEVGQTVEEETVVCIIEAMKVMNEIKAEASGRIVKIMAENGSAVEFGQPLFLIEPV